MISRPRVALHAKGVAARRAKFGVKMILYHAADLIWATKIKATAEAAGIAARPVRTLEMLEARLADSPVTALLVDLEAPEVAVALIRRVVAEPGRQIRTLAYGPHVAADAFSQAEAAGADRVIARGALDARMSSILRDLAAPELPEIGG